MVYEIIVILLQIFNENYKKEAFKILPQQHPTLADITRQNEPSTLAKR